MSALPLALDRLRKLRIPFLNHVLDGDLCKNFLDIYTSSFFWVSIMILSYILMLPMPQLQTQQQMTSQIRSRIEYIIQTKNIIVLILYSKLMRNVAAQAVFNTVFDSGLLFRAIV